MKLGLEGKLAVVTGASRGLGLATAEALLDEGARVVLGARTADDLQQARENLLASRTDATVATAVLDVMDADSIRAFAASVRAQQGDPDILVSNAGGPKPGTWDDVTADDFPTAMNLCFLFAVRLFEEFLPAMRRNGFGRIVHIASISARQPLDRLILSNASRAAMVGFSKSVSNQVAKDGVTVNVVLPGFTRTDRTVELADELAQASGGTPEEVVKGWESVIPAGRMGEPRELADTITFLCSQNAGYITGTTLAVDGGFVKGIP